MATSTKDEVAMMHLNTIYNYTFGYRESPGFRWSVTKDTRLVCVRAYLSFSVSDIEVSRCVSVEIQRNRVNAFL